MELMPIGPGKYDAICTHAREAADAEGVVLIILNGKRGSGFSVQASPVVTALLADLLRNTADLVEKAVARDVEVLNE
jgi:hypothetical protein